MNLKVYQKYLISNYLIILSQVTTVFVIIGIIMGLLEEINFFSEFDVKYYYPIILVLLNIPSLIYEIFPFIFLITTQFFLLN